MFVRFTHGFRGAQQESRVCIRQGCTKRHQDASQALACGGYIMLIRDNALWDKELWNHDGCIVQLLQDRLTHNETGSPVVEV